MLVVYQNLMTVPLHVSLEGLFYPSVPLFPEAITKLTADGDELEFIRKNFTNIPMYNGPGRTVTFTRETAAFIAHNIRFR